MCSYTRHPGNWSLCQALLRPLEIHLHVYDGKRVEMQKQSVIDGRPFNITVESKRIPLSINASLFPFYFILYTRVHLYD